MSPDRFRRASGLVFYWSGAQCVCFTWRSRQRIPLTLAAAGVLDQLPTWTTIEELHERIAPGGDVTTVGEMVTLLQTLQLVEREGQHPATEWLTWAPEATFFHFATKDGRFPEDVTARDRELVDKARHHPQPPATKRVEGQRIDLPETLLEQARLEAALTARRTWRHFSPRPIPLASLGAILNMTFGVQHRASVKGQGPVILRSSPSGGSRHPIEAYVLAWNVEGLRAGAYHYDSDTRQLVDLSRSIAPADIAPMLAYQTYFARAAAIVVMCPVFARTMWRYEHSRAYRTVLIEAGHLGQTFALVATAMGLAPFTTMAFSESRLEALLGLDGIEECPIYVAGVGSRDADSNRAPGRWQD